MHSCLFSEHPKAVLWCLNGFPSQTFHWARGLVTTDEEQVEVCWKFFSFLLSLSLSPRNKPADLWPLISAIRDFNAGFSRTRQQKAPPTLQKNCIAYIFMASQCVAVGNDRCYSGCWVRSKPDFQLVCFYCFSQTGNTLPMYLGTQMSLIGAQENNLTQVFTANF